MPGRFYRLVVSGEMGAATRAAFPDLHAHAERGQTVLSGEIRDQAALYSVLERFQSLGLDLVDVSVEGDER
jgi:hypothetical protein